LPCCILCCLPAPDLTRFRSNVISVSLRHFQSARLSRRINPLKITLPTKYLIKIEEEMLKAPCQYAPYAAPSTTLSLRYLYLEIYLKAQPGVVSNDLTTGKPNTPRLPLLPVNVTRLNFDWLMETMRLLVGSIGNIQGFTKYRNNSLLEQSCCIPIETVINLHCRAKITFRVVKFCRYV